jgi:hypothetical protein
MQPDVWYSNENEDYYLTLETYFHRRAVMGVIWHKIWSDLWNNKGRTLQVVVIIAMGAFAIGMIIGAREAVSAQLIDHARMAAQP